VDASNEAERHSHFVDWPEGCSIDEVEVRYVRQSNGGSATWIEVERIPHPSGIEGLPGRIEIVFRPPG
jgi:hypothetical protein